MDILKKITHLEKEAAAFGFQWETSSQIMEQIRSECLEVEEHLNVESNKDTSALQEEIGDLLHAVFSLCVFCKLDPKETLQQTVDKFERRFLAVKMIAKEKQLTTLQGLSFDELMSIWKQAKKSVI
jgi:uncharacterized protein YabN with tetrapyrrole methylase and pyrophosphatase domain